MGSLGWAGAAPQPHVASRDGETAIKLLSEVVTSSVLVWFGRQSGMKSWVCDGLDFFKAPWAVYSVLGAAGPRAADAPVAVPLEIDGSRL